MQTEIIDAIHRCQDNLKFCPIFSSKDEAIACARKEFGSLLLHETFFADSGNVILYGNYNVIAVIKVHIESESYYEVINLKNELPFYEDETKIVKLLDIINPRIFLLTESELEECNNTIITSTGNIIKDGILLPSAKKITTVNTVKPSNCLFLLVLRIMRVM